MEILSPSLAPRLGFHYFPDMVHYRVQDLETWLPELLRLGASWITLLAPIERAIPEYFLTGLLKANIQPVLHFQLPAHQPMPGESSRLMLSNYARWGVRYVAFYDRPNLRANWRPSSWVQTDLVEHFLDYFLPLAGVALQEGLTPVFPPLEPGGDYWDLAFLRTALRSIARRDSEGLLEALTLSAYAWTGRHSVDWGNGGPQRWPGVRPYYTPPEAQDHLGFRIFDWYLAISEQELGRRLPIFLLRAGSIPEDHDGKEGAKAQGVAHAQTNLTLARLFAGEQDEAAGLEPIPPEVLACNFWLLCAQEQSSYAAQAWFQPEESRLPVVDALRQWIAIRRKNQTTPGEMVKGLAKEDDESLVDRVIFSGVDPRPRVEPESLIAPLGDFEREAEKESAGIRDELEPEEEKEQLGEQVHPITHYVLLPLYAWGVANWDLSLIQPLMEESHPTVGFSLAEARLATRVTVVGGEGAISPEALDMLRSSGCRVERILEDGTLIAS